MPYLGKRFGLLICYCLNCQRESIGRRITASLASIRCSNLIGCAKADAALVGKPAQSPLQTQIKNVAAKTESAEPTLEWLMQVLVKREETRS